MALVIACWRDGDTDRIKRLLCCGADPNASHCVGRPALRWTPLDMALQREWPALVELLVAYGAQLPAGIMIKAANLGCDIPTLVALRDAGADVCERHNGHLALCEFIELGALEQARWCVRMGCTARVWCTADLLLMQRAMSTAAPDMFEWLLCECGIPLPNRVIVYNKRIAQLVAKASVAPWRVHPHYWKTCAAHLYACVDAIVDNT